MIERYAHPSVTAAWSDHWTYNAWLNVETAVLSAQIQAGVVPDEEGHDLLQWALKHHILDDETLAIREREQTTRHDFVAFLEQMREDAPGLTGRWLHYGLTSSDVIDTTLALRFKYLHMPISADLTDLVAILSGWTRDNTPVVGRTHGQPAEPTSMQARAAHWLVTISPTIKSLLTHARHVQVAKLSGPVGTFAHNPVEVETIASQMLMLQQLGAGASQIAPRSSLALWATSVAVFAAACAKIATDIRLMNMMGEATEARPEGAVGSSSMAHKHNPIIAEQICGLARVAQGYAAMLTPLDLWLERDISHSSVERIAVPDLYHLLFHITKQTTLLLAGLELNEFTVDQNIDDDCNTLFVSKNTNAALHDAVITIDEAREIGLTTDMCGSYADPAWHTRNYPKGHEHAGL